MAEVAAGRKPGRPSPFGTLIQAGSEDEIQATFIQWVNINMHGRGCEALKAIFSIPNAGFASQKQGGLRKLTGRRAGVPDICCPVECWNRETHEPLHIGLWIEFKVQGKYPTKEQLEWHERLRGLGHRVEVCFDWVTAANIVIEYLGLPLAKL